MSESLALRRPREPPAPFNGAALLPRQRQRYSEFRPHWLARRHCRAGHLARPRAVTRRRAEGATGQRWKLNFATAAAEVEAAKKNTTG